MSERQDQIASSQKDRELRGEERQLIRYLLAGKWPEEKIDAVLLESRVQDMRDGGMGSILFLGPAGRKLGKVAAESEYTDIDGVPVLISVNVDETGRLFELDFWKVDFSPLKQYPKGSDLILKGT